MTGDKHLNVFFPCETSRFCNNYLIIQAPLLQSSYIEKEPNNIIRKDKVSNKVIKLEKICIIRLLELLAQSLSYVCNSIQYTSPSLRVQQNNRRRVEMLLIWAYRAKQYYHCSEYSFTSVCNIAADIDHPIKHSTAVAANWRLSFIRTLKRQLHLTLSGSRAMY